MKIKNMFTLLLLGLLLILSSCTNNVASDNVTSIEVSDESQLIFKSSEFDLSKIYINTLHENGDITENIPVTIDMIEGALPNSLGKHTLTIVYEGQTCEIEIEFIGVSSLVFTEDSVSVFELDSFNVRLIDMYLVYTNGSREKINVTTDMITGLDQLTEIGEYVVQITYSGLTVNYDIEIVEKVDVENFTFEAMAYNEGYIVTGYNGTQTNVVIPSEYNGLPVKEIGNQAFFKENSIQRVIIPSTVVAIREAAFYQSTSIKSIVIPSSVTTIEAYGVRGIKTIYLESESIPATYASNWYDEQNSYINYGIKAEELKFNGTYEYYVKDGGVVLSNYFGSESIVYLPSLIDNYLPTVVGGACFKDNTNIEELYIPESVVKLENYALAGLTSLTVLQLSSNIEEIGDYAIRGCSIITSITLPKELRRIGHSAFNHCSALKEIIVPSKVEYIGDYAFSWCVGVKKIYIPLNVQVIKAGACYSCSSATIYTAYTSAPSTWETGWNQSNRPIKWGQEE